MTTDDHLYETETMAELCARQGRLGEAISIYRALSEHSSDPATRGRAQTRLATLESTWQPLREIEVPPAEIPVPVEPGVAVLVTDDQMTVAWALPAEIAPRALDVLVLQRTGSGVEAQKKLLPVESPSGRLGLAVPSIHSAIAAAGTVRAGRFVALATSTASR